MDEGEEINGLNGGSPMQMNGVNGGNLEEMNGMSSINGLQIMNTFSLSKEKSNGFSNEKVTSLLVRRQFYLYLVNLRIKH